jgi:hypothetical protein
VFTVIITGSRNWTDARTLNQELNALLAQHPEMVVRHGDCPTGADMLASIWCREHDVPEIRHPADWDQCSPTCPPGHRRMKFAGDTVHPGKLPDYCPKAGPNRNHEMASAGGDICLAFPLGTSRGTMNCMRHCADVGIPVRVIEERTYV